MSKSMINKKVRVYLQETRGLRAKLKDGGLFSGKSRVSLATLPPEVVQGYTGCLISDQ
jgi:hypothetical protein